MWNPFARPDPLRQSRPAEGQAEVPSGASMTPAVASADQWIRLVVRAVLLFVTIGVVVQYVKVWQAPDNAFIVEGPACVAAIVEP